MTVRKSFETRGRRFDITCIKELYNITRKLSGKGFFRNSKPVRNKKGEILSTKEQQLQRWRKHFSESLNREKNKKHRDKKKKI
jgi:hypothetical protein